MTAIVQTETGVSNETLRDFARCTLEDVPATETDEAKVECETELDCCRWTRGKTDEVGRPWVTVGMRYCRN